MAPSSSTVGSTIAARQPALTLVEPWLAEPRAQTGGAFGSITIRMALPASWILPDRLTCSGPQMNADSHRPSERSMLSWARQQRINLRRSKQTGREALVRTPKHVDSVGCVYQLAKKCEAFRHILATRVFLWPAFLFISRLGQPRARSSNIQQVGREHLPLNRVGHEWLKLTQAIVRDSRGYGCVESFVCPEVLRGDLCERLI